MRRLLTLTALALFLAAPGVAAGAPVFVITGFGWGHGIGMAQYGAYGYAQHGWTYDQILAHYYPGTELGPAPAGRIRVLLVSGRDAVDIASDSSFTVKDADGRLRVPAGVYHLGKNFTLQVDGQSRTLVPPVRFLPGKRPLRLDRAYRGSVVVSLQGGALAAVNDVKLEQYVKGVVAGEMEAEWHQEALKVQAVAARSYALASRRTGLYFDVYPDTRSQVYGGIEAEDSRTSAAVDATKGQVVLYQGKVAWTFFSASSGGKTAAAQDVWTDSEALPYLVSVEDPYDDISPYHRWGPLTFTAEQLAAKFGSHVSGELLALEETPNASGRVATVTITGTGGVTELTGSELRTLLGLRSTWFQIDVAGGLSASARRIVYGEEVTLSGVAPGVERVMVEQRPAGGRWSALQTVDVRKNGAFSVTAKPQVTTSFRARLPSTRSAPVRVAVAPEVTLGAKKRALAGVTRPELPGVAVRIERRNGSGWEAVGSATAGDGGRFAVELELVPGSYRARVPATAGLAEGVSAQLTIVAG